MQSPTPPPNTPKKNSPFIKWLPAILLALIIHGVLIYFFLNSQKNTTTETTADSNETSAEAIDLNNEQEVLLTLQEETNSSEKEQLTNQDKEGEEKEDKTAEQKAEDQQSEENNAQAKADTKEDSESEKDITANNGAGSKPNQANNQNRAPAQQQPLPMDNSSYLPPAQPNPNDQVLLPRDLPKAEQKLRGQNDEYAETAEQSEDLSDQLSSIVNDVKEQKLRQIEAQQRASKEAYLSNQPAASKPAAEKATPTKPTASNPNTENAAESETEQSISP